MGHEIHDVWCQQLPTTVGPTSRHCGQMLTNMDHSRSVIEQGKMLYVLVLRGTTGNSQVSPCWILLHSQQCQGWLPVSLPSHQHHWIGQVCGGTFNHLAMQWRAVPTHSKVHTSHLALPQKMFCSPQVSHWYAGCVLQDCQHSPCFPWCKQDFPSVVCEA